MSGVEAVAFDLGDTLWHFPHPRPPEALARAHLQRLRSVLTARGLDPELASTLRARLTEGWDEWERSADERGGVGPDYIEGTRSVVAELALPRDAAEAIWQCMALGGPFLGRRLFEETHETLDWLRASGFRLAIITNRAHGDELFMEELHAYGLRDPFEAIISSDQVGFRKPHPRIFEAALVAPPDRVPTAKDQQPDYTIDELRDLRGLDLFL